MQKTLGTTFDELGMEVADLWHLPTLIITSMKTIPEQEIKNKKRKNRSTQENGQFCQ